MEKPTPIHIAEQEVDRLQQMLSSRKARVADAERKLAAAQERCKDARERKRGPSAPRVPLDGVTPPPRGH